MTQDCGPFREPGSGHEVKHLDAPGGLTVPGGHVEHESPAVVTSSVKPAGFCENVPAGQIEHESEPATLPVPGAHGASVPPGSVPTVAPGAMYALDENVPKKPAAVMHPANVEAVVPARHNVHDDAADGDA